MMMMMMMMDHFLHTRILCLNSVDGSGSYTTLLLAFAAVQYSRSQVQQLLIHMMQADRQADVDKGGVGVHMCVLGGCVCSC